MDTEDNRMASDTFELEKPISVVVIAQGYYDNRVLNIGQKFQYSGRIKKNGKGELVLPLWVELDESVEGNEIKIKDEDQKSQPKKEESKEVKSSKGSKVKSIKDLL